MRVRFLKKGEQRKFLESVIEKLKAPSLRGLLQFGFSINYSTLKNYYNEDRLMSEELVRDFCEVAGIDFGGLDVEIVGDNWGRVLGGLKSKK